MAKKTRGKTAVNARSKRTGPQKPTQPKKTKASTQQTVSVVESGAVRRTSISIDKTPIPMTPTDDGFSGSASVTLVPPSIVAKWEAKGVKDDSYDFEVTINGKTQSIKGFLKTDGLNSDEQAFTFDDFGLGK